jgi:hypothetical protein
VCVPHARDVEVPQPKSQEPGYAGMCEPAVPSSARQGSCRWEIEGTNGSVISKAGEGCTWAYISTKGVPMSFTTFGRRLTPIGKCLVSTPLFSFSIFLSVGVDRGSRSKLGERQGNWKHKTVQWRTHGEELTKDSFLRVSGKFVDSSCGLSQGLGGDWPDGSPVYGTILSGHEEIRSTLGKDWSTTLRDRD